MRVGIIGGSIAGCATAALLHRAGHDVTVFERSESDLVSRGAGIVMATAAWQDMMAHGLIDGTLPACRADCCRFDTRIDALDGCELLRPVYQGGHGVVYYIPGSGESSVPFGQVHPEVRADLESRLAGLLPPLLFELVQQSGNSSIQAIYSFAPRSYARDRLCLVGDAGTVFPPFTGSGVLRAVASATSLRDALADASAVDDALRRWSAAQLQAAAQVLPAAERIERSYVFDMPDLTTMPTTATNDWLSAAFPGLVVTLPGV
jgi:2-polyprenyl-6-methoxyphenol hydroxylase-like FAD-dependent oxidoreductase